MQLHLHLVRADLLERLGQVDLLALDLVALLRELLVDVLARHRAEQLVLRAGLAGELHLDGVELVRHRGHVLPLLGRARHDAGLLVLQPPHVLLGGRHRELPREQVIAAVARLHFHQRAGLAQVLQIFGQDDFHVGLYWCAMTVYGSSATLRPRLMAVATSRWCRAQFPEMRRGTILPRSVTKYFKSAAFL